MRRPTKSSSSEDEEEPVYTETHHHTETTTSVTADLNGEIPIVRWTNRRKMAWRAFYVFITYTLIYWFILPLWFQYFGLPTTWLDIIGESFFWFAVTMSTVILGYMGFTTMPFMGGRNKNRYKVDQEDY